MGEGDDAAQLGLGDGQRPKATGSRTASTFFNGQSRNFAMAFYKKRLRLKIVSRILYDLDSLKNI